MINEWGERFWILNPAQYQLESKEGTGLMEMHAETLHYNLEELQRVTPRDPISGNRAPFGGDYMRMWTKVLVEDDCNYYFGDTNPNRKELKNTAQHVDAFYFMGPRDMNDFFSKSGAQTLTSGIEIHFARKFATDPDFRESYSINSIVWDKDRNDDDKLSNEERNTQDSLRAIWSDLRRQYIRFYALRASVNFSLGSHDEWEIFRRINVKRRKVLEKGNNFGVAEQLAGFFDGSQIAPGTSEAELSRGYSIG